MRESSFPMESFERGCELEVSRSSYPRDGECLGSAPQFQTEPLPGFRWHLHQPDFAEQISRRRLASTLIFPAFGRMLRMQTNLSAMVAVSRPAGGEMSGLTAHFLFGPIFR
jgi:hypothetical protein